MRLPRKHLIAVVCANVRHTAEIKNAVRQFYTIEDYVQSADALAGMEKTMPRLALVDEQVYPDGGAAFVGRLRAHPAFADMPVIFMVSSPSAPQTIVLQSRTQVLRPPYQRSRLIKAVADLINADVERHWQSLPVPQRKLLDDTLAAFNTTSAAIGSGLALDYGPVEAACGSVVAAVNDAQYATLLRAVREHDNYTYAHSVRVATLLALFGHVLGLSQGDQLLLASGGLLHDAGKIIIDPILLNKAGALTPAERGVLEGHVAATTKLLKRGRDIPKGIITIASNHHEKLDGSGYPNGLRAGQMDELARMSAIVDVFSAMTDRRPYKASMEAEAAFAIMVTRMRTQLDMHLVELFREVLLDGMRILP